MRKIRIFYFWSYFHICKFYYENCETFMFCMMWKRKCRSYENLLEKSSYGICVFHFSSVTILCCSGWCILSWVCLQMENVRFFFIDFYFLFLSFFVHFNFSHEIKICFSHFVYSWQLSRSNSLFFLLFICFFFYHMFFFSFFSFVMKNSEWRHNCLSRR